MSGQNGRLEQKVQNKGNVSHKLCLHSHSVYNCVSRVLVRVCVYVVALCRLYALPAALMSVSPWLLLTQCVCEAVGG